MAEELPGKVRKERHKRLLGKGWPRVTMMRDKVAKLSPPWCWWLEDDNFNHEKYETETYIPVSALLSDEVVEAAREAGRGASVFEDDTDPDYIDLISDAALQAVIEQVGGAE